MKQFNSNEQKAFWAGDKVYSKGDIIAPVILSLSKRYIGEKAIDIGAGSGALLRAFKIKYKDKKTIVGVDIAPKTKDITYADCTSLPCENNSFDTCFCTDIIEHLSDADIEKFLTELNRILAKGGYAIFSTIDNEILDHSTVKCPECGCRFHARGHCQVMNKNRVHELFGRKGFRIVSVKVLKLHFLAKFKTLAKIFYMLHLDRIMNVNFLTADLFFIARKEQDL